ncbi:MAG TPA: formylglycine-generating enzyme family protein, partial [Candidatus Competibacteraceae bacterium]|nr:formylglycine-generating enzyme family protein [Candidatus Competibacteraceae bacterium]
LRQKVAALIRAHHVHLSPVIGYEERLLLAELNKADDPAAQQFSERIIKTLHTQEGAFAESLRAWFGRLTPRQHPAMWQNDALAAAWATVFLRQLQEGRASPPGLDLSRISWLLGRGQARQRYTLRQRGQALYLETDALTPSDNTLDAPGSPLGEINAAASWVQLQRSRADSACPAELIQSLSQAIPLDPEGFLRLCTDHQELTIEPFCKPDWAEAISRDEFGLLVSWQNKKRHAYWLNPSIYPIFNRSDECVDQLNLLKGCWQNKTFSLTQQRQYFREPHWANDFGVDEYGLYAVFRVQSVQQCLRWIAPGEFLMGSPETEAGRDYDESQHLVILTRGFWLADTACTQALWRAVMGDNPSYFKGAERPVERVSWGDVQTFLRRLNGIVPGGGFRLPTEAEWEYACRAGTKTPFWFGEQMAPKQVNYDGNHPYTDGVQGQYREKTVDVKALPCNGWGLYQMHGNVWEWCWDGYSDYPTDTVIDPVEPIMGKSLVVRGGSWFHYGRNARSACRYYFVSGYRNYFTSFRLARVQVDITVTLEDQLNATDKLERQVEIKTDQAGPPLQSSIGPALRRLWKRMRS